MDSLSAIIQDRRLNGKDKSINNRQKFLRRVRGQIRDQLPELVAEKKLESLGTTGGVVKIKRRLISEPTFREASIGQGGQRDFFLPGNDQYVVGDVIPKEEIYGSAGGAGRGAGGEEDEEVEAVLGSEEFMKFFFDGMELPNLVEQEISKLYEKEYHHAGYIVDGAPHALAIVRSYKESLKRKIPTRTNLEKRIAQLEEQLAIAELEDDQRKILEELLARLQKRIGKIPFFDPMDLRFRATQVKHVPTTHATMIMIMDVSGSMQTREKAIAKKFFYLLYAFLKLNYEKVDMVFIMHTHVAHRVEEDEFFDAGRTGSTTVSSALELAGDIIKKELLGKTNIYVAQISDGDNEDTDNGTCREIMEDDIMPFVQYFAYVQIDDYHSDPEQQMNTSHVISYGKGLWDAYKIIEAAFKNFQMKRVHKDSDIFPVFKELFKKRNTK